MWGVIQALITQFTFSDPLIRAAAACPAGSDSLSCLVSLWHSPGIPSQCCSSCWGCCVRCGLCSPLPLPLVKKCHPTALVKQTRLQAKAWYLSTRAVFSHAGMDGGISVCCVKQQMRLSNQCCFVSPKSIIETCYEWVTWCFDVRSSSLFF